MTPNERDLITDLFDRMRRQGLTEIDDEAAELIARSMRANPDAAYQLVQTVIVQNMALERAEQKIADLEEEVEAAAAARPARSSGGSFLAGIFGGGGDEPERAPPRPTPTQGQPAAGTRFARDADRTSGGTPWSGAGRAGPPERGARGSFLGTAMTTAAGVAGGMLLADGIRGLFNDGAGPSVADAGKQAAGSDAASGAQADQNVTDASTGDEGGSFLDGLFGGGGGDDGGDDLMEI